MESSDQDLQASCPEFPGQIGCAGKLVGLYSNKRHNYAAFGKPVRPQDTADWYCLDGIVVKLNLKLNIAAQRPVFVEVPRQAGKAGKRVAWEYAAKMTNDVSFIVIFGRLYEDDTYLLPFGCRVCQVLSHDSINC